MHHGSGPRHTSLLDPEFPQKLARYASLVAERYPWLDAYTPVNEPNTTARFSGMYGVWYPHHLSRTSYLRALLNQMKGTVLSMEAIRRVRRDAQLVQTDDVGRVCGTEELRGTWELLNERQWLTFDLLCGMVDRQHPVFAYMLGAGVNERRDSLVSRTIRVRPNRDRRELLRRPATVISIIAWSFIPRTAGPQRAGSWTLKLCVCVVKALPALSSLLSEAWRRYGIPVAITEVHLGCCVDEQIRWVAELWHAAQRTRQEGVDCRAVTDVGVAGFVLLEPTGHAREWPLRARASSI